MNFLVGALLNEGGRGLAQVLLVIAACLLLLVFTIILVPVAIVAQLFGSPTTVGAAILSGLIPAAPRVIPAPPPAAPPPPVDSRPVDVARRYLGVPYAFGGTDPATGLDCSGLVQLVFRQLGTPLPRTAQLQYDATTRLTRDQLQPGDLVFFARTYADPNDWITHVGIYIGNGQQINAPTEGQVVSIQPVFTGFWGAHFVAGGRVALAHTFSTSRKESA